MVFIFCGRGCAVGDGLFINLLNNELSYPIAFQGAVNIRMALSCISINACRDPFCASATGL